MVVGSCAGTEQRAISEVTAQAESSELSVGIDSCNLNPIVDVVESTTEVRLEARVGRSFLSSEDDCRDSVKVTLDNPLGSRTVIDESSDKAVPITPPD